MLSRGWYFRFADFEKYLQRLSWFEAAWKGPSITARVAAGREVVFFGDGVGGFTTVEKAVNPMGTANYTLLNSGKADASSRTDRLIAGANGTHSAFVSS